MTTFDVGWIMDYETGQLSDADLLAGFADGIASGKVWHLQGHYGRTAAALIENGLITENGELTDKADEILLESR